MTAPAQVMQSNTVLAGLLKVEPQSDLQLEATNVDLPLVHVPSLPASSPQTPIALLSFFHSAVAKFVIDRDKADAAESGRVVAPAPALGQAAAKAVEKKYHAHESDQISADGRRSGNELLPTVHSAREPDPPFAPHRLAEPLELRNAMTLIVCLPGDPQTTSVDVRVARDGSNTRDDDEQNSTHIVEFDIGPGDSGMVGVTLHMTGRRLSIALTSDDLKLVHELRGGGPELEHCLGKMELSIKSFVVRNGTKERDPP